MYGLWRENYCLYIDWDYTLINALINIKKYYNNAIGTILKNIEYEKIMKFQKI